MPQQGRSTATAFTDVSVDADDVVWITDRDTNLPRNRNGINEVLDAVADISEGRLLPVLWDARQMSRPSPAGWLTFTDGVAASASAVAIVVDDRSRAVLGGFPRVFASLLLQVRMFESESDAHEWLMTANSD